MRLLNDFWAKQKLDWREWINHRDVMYKLKRDKKLIDRAIDRAKVKNAMDGRTYLIIRNSDGNPEEFPSGDMSVLRRLKLIPKEMTYEKVLVNSFAVVTSNHVARNQYTAKSVDKKSSYE